MKQSSGETLARGRGFSRGAAVLFAAALAGALCLGGCGQASTEPGGTAGEEGSAAASVEEAQEAGQGEAQSSESAAEGTAQESGQQEGAAGESDDAHGDSLDADKALEGQTDAHPVSFTVEAPGYGSSDGKIPIAVAGERVDGTQVDATAYIGPDGSGLELAPGQYTVTVIESPLMGGGKFLRAPGKSWDVIVGDTLGSGESVSVEGTMQFAEMDPSEVTKDEVETAYTYAVSGGLAKSTAKKYRAQILEAAGLA